MANTSKKFIEDRNRIEALHNEWCVENGYPVRWTRLQAGRPKLQATSDRLHAENSERFVNSAKPQAASDKRQASSEASSNKR